MSLSDSSLRAKACRAFIAGVGGSPRRRPHGETETGDKRRVGLVGFRAGKLALGEAFYAGGVDDADDVAGFVKEFGQPVAVCPRGLHADVGFFYTVAEEPLDKQDEALYRVWEHFAFDLGVQNQRHVEFFLRNVCADNLVLH
jgi:hypothetical protein